MFRVEFNVITKLQRNRELREEKYRKINNVNVLEICKSGLHENCIPLMQWWERARSPTHVRVPHTHTPRPR